MAQSKQTWPSFGRCLSNLGGLRPISAQFGPIVVNLGRFGVLVRPNTSKFSKHWTNVDQMLTESAKFDSNRPNDDQIGSLGQVLVEILPILVKLRQMCSNFDRWWPNWAQFGSNLAKSAPMNHLIDRGILSTASGQLRSNIDQHLAVLRPEWPKFGHHRTTYCPHRQILVDVFKNWTKFGPRRPHMLVEILQKRTECCPRRPQILVELCKTWTQFGPRRPKFGPTLSI